MSSPSPADIIISPKCLTKMLLHCFKYPHATVNGVMIGLKKKDKNGVSYMELLDCVPLFHLGHGLTPMLEMALLQISSHYKNKPSLEIAGYYQANKYFNDSTPTVFAMKIAEKVWEQNSDSSMFMINNFGLANAFESVKELDKAVNLYQFGDGKWKLKNGGFRIDRAETTLDALNYFIYDVKLHESLNDFDNHLDDIKIDWTNEAVNQVLDEFINEKDK